LKDGWERMSDGWERMEDASLDVAVGNGQERSTLGASRAGAEFRMVVEEGKIREFAKAVKSADPAYLSGPAPLSPATFLASATFWQDAASSPWGDRPPPHERLLHGEQTFIFHREPPRAGEVLIGRVRLGEPYFKTGRRGGDLTFTEMTTEFRTESGDLVAEAIATLIITSQAPTGTAT
jgi:hypothetical protein